VRKRLTPARQVGKPMLSTREHDVSDAENLRVYHVGPSLFRPNDISQFAKEAGLPIPDEALWDDRARGLSRAFFAALAEHENHAYRVSEEKRASAFGNLAKSCQNLLLQFGIENLPNAIDDPAASVHSSAKRNPIVLDFVRELDGEDIVNVVRGLGKMAMAAENLKAGKRGPRSAAFAPRLLLELAVQFP
jgi:hypothetical protein